MLIDTDVLIWMTRGHAAAAARLQLISPWRISAVTYIELVQGCRDKQELKRIKQGLAQCDTCIVPVTASISARAMDLVDIYALSHNMQLGDALIAATALEHGNTVLTANAKHFGPVDGLRIELFTP
ncbi:PIN domain protein [Oxalobacteraceae bacterium IMCC9480]|jgi:predicted nucleic acid-binding protein|nr:PIN domain protein [Oxalobacteraceae bacterium IMCC9480]NDP60397.1 type II toxin-antitoxin system VapC family toxin [Oxalobacteraceae bacterium]